MKVFANSIVTDFLSPLQLVLAFSIASHNHLAASFHLATLHHDHPRSLPN
jgi:hypothetical protein